MSTVRIPLPHGRSFVMDEEDLPLLEGWTVKLSTGKRRSTLYVGLSRMRNRKTETAYLHRLILNAPEGMLTDHLNGNGLDNRRENLRLTTHSGNGFNKVPGRRNKTGVLNVGLIGGRFVVQLVTDGKNRKLGSYDTLEEAAVVAYKARLEHYGPAAVARLPKPEGLQL